jgi:hypothetical protein
MSKTKAGCVAQSLAANPEGFKNLQPYSCVLQHSSEHHGLVVAYYRASGLVPPQSRRKKGAPTSTET